MKVSIAIPFYNEEENAENVIRETSKILSRSCDDYEIIAVDNGSSDKTSEIIDNMLDDRIRKVTVRDNMGYGWGVIKGLMAAEGDIIGWTCGDGQIDPSCIPKLLELAKSKDHEGIFKVNRIKREDGAQRKFVSSIYNGLMKTMFKVHTNDVNGCPKFFKKEIFDDMDLESMDWFIDSEILIKARKNGLDIHELPVVFKERAGGKFNVRFSTALEFMKNMIHSFKRNNF